MTDSLTDRVRSACEAVAARSAHVRINLDQIAGYARSLPMDEAVSLELDAERHYLGHGDDTVAFMVTLDAINFGSGYFPHLRKRPGMSGYFTVASSLTDHFRREGPLSAGDLERITADDCAAIFGQDLRVEAVRELMSLFANSLNDLGRYVRTCFQGSFTALVASAGNSAQRLVGVLAEMPYFQDVERYRDLEVPFYKRAQIVASDLSLAFDGKGSGRFDDLERLTIFADNLVPHVLRVDGLLEYDDSLLDRISKEELIPLGSEEEIEIRACAVHTVELLVGAFRDSGHAVNAMQLDSLLWNRGQQPYYKARPRHRTRCVYY